MYSHVWVDHPTQTKRPLIYRIPEIMATEVQVGSLIYIPFRNSILLGLVARITRSYNQGTIRSQPKLIYKILSSHSVLTRQHWQLVRWFQNYLGVSIQEAIFTIIPKLPQPYLHELHALDLTIVRSRPKRLLRTERLYLTSYEQKISFMVRMSQRWRSLGAQVLILLPEINDIIHVSKLITHSLRYDASLASQGKLAVWQAAQSISNATIIGTRSALFLPYTNLRVIICDRPFHPGFFEKRRPRHSVWSACLAIARVYQSNLLFTDEAIAPIFLHQQQYIELKNPGTPFIATFEPESRQKQIDCLYTIISRVMTKGHTACIIVPKKGEFTGFTCNDCHAHYDGIVDRCLVCQSDRFKSYGLGTQSIIRFFKSHWPRLPVDRVDSDQPIDSKVSFVVATQQIFDFRRYFDESIILGLDYQLSLPDPLAPERVYRLIAQAVSRTRLQSTIITRLPDHDLFKNLGSPRKTLRYLLDMRHSIDAFPYGKIIKIISSQPLSERIVRAMRIYPGVKNIEVIPSLFDRGKYHCIIHVDRSTNTELILKHMKYPLNARVDVDPLTLV